MAHPPGASDRFLAAQAAARTAGRIALARFKRPGGLVIERKGPQDPVSDADRQAEAMIREEIAARFPRDGFLGEESGPNAAFQTASHVWVVDPIDGTACFVSGVPAWCVSVALVVEGEIDLGVVYDPNAEELYAAARGRGATLNGAPVRASEAKNLSLGAVGVGFSRRVPPGPTLEVLGKLLESGGMFQRNGSGALSLAYAAAGRYLGYYEAHINPWDAMAGVALVREAGGWTNDFLADDCLAKGNAVLACAPGVARQLREICGM